MEETAQPQAAPEANQLGEIAEAAVETSMINENMEPFLTVKYNKQEKNLSQDEAREYAQKGMNYDKISDRLKQTKQRLIEYEKTSSAKANGINRQESVNRQLSEFVANNPELDPRNLPKEIIEAWKNGVPLGEAAAKYHAENYRRQTQELKRKIEQLKINESNSLASMGRAHSNGSTQQKPLTVEAIKRMSRREVEKNHDRIWEFLTGVKKNK